MYYEFYPLWRTFLERLGFEVVTSTPTTKALVERGASLAVDEACLPVKLAFGHVADLAGRCDALFLPRLVTIEPNGFLCPKIVGLPDMVGALPLEVPRVIAPCVDLESNPDPAAPFVAAAKELGRSARAARAAYCEARRVQDTFRESVRRGRSLRTALEDFERDPGALLEGGTAEAAGQASETNGGARLRLAVLGHPYNIHDPYLSMDIARKLESLGCEVVPVETVPEERCREALAGFGHNVYWIFGRRVLGPVLHFMRDRSVDGIIYVVSFGCGPDALIKAIVDLTAKRHPDLPYMPVVLDEHSGEAGLLTRLEAFVDMTRRMKARWAAAPARDSAGAGRPPHPEAHGHVRGPEGRRYAVSFPHAGSVWIPLRAMMEDLGINCLVPPENSRRTLDIGSQHSPELACLPFKLMLGNYVEALQRGATHLLALSSNYGATCRLYFFPAAHEAILRDMGFDFEMVSLATGRADSPTGIAKLTRERVGRSVWQFARLFFATFARKLLACEKVERLAARARPFEARPGEATRLARAALEAVDRCEPHRLRRLMRSVEEAFRSIATRDPERRPLRVGIVGELFVLLDPFANLNMEERLGELGVLVKRNFWASKKILRTIWRWFDPEYARAMRAASRFLGADIGAECNVTVGDTVEYRRHGFDGLVHLMPFTCMPEIVAESMLPRAKATSGMPVITFALDEQTSAAGLQTRLEAFVELLDRQRRNRPEAGARRVPGAASVRARACRASKHEGALVVP
jgi:predicted nucleotide-binding protein (sugar kinase/HSP70/actin superfamily)